MTLQLQLQIVIEIIYDKFGPYIDVCYNSYEGSINQLSPNLKTCTNKHKFTISQIEPQMMLVVLNKRLITQKLKPSLQLSQEELRSEHLDKLSPEFKLQIERTTFNRHPIFHLKEMPLAIAKIKEIDDNDSDCYELFKLCDQLYST